MGDDGSVLSQAEIDALFRQATGSNIARTAAPAAVATPPAPHVSTPPAELKAAPVAPPPKAQAATPPFPKPAVPDGRIASPHEMSSTEIKALLAEQKTQLDLLTRRIAKLETSLLEINQPLSQDITGDSGMVQSQINQFTSILRRVVKQTAGIQKGLDGTPAYNLVREFTCSECGSHGHLAVPVTCTQCGTEGWWGWWPKDV